MKQKYFILFGIIAIICVILISGCFQKPLTLKPEVLQPKTAPQPGVSTIIFDCAKESYFSLGKILDKQISNNDGAFEVLKEYWYFCVEGAEVEDCIPTDMIGDEAAKKGILEYTNILLENQEKIEAWLLYRNYAVDSKGNVYGCIHPESE